MQTRTWGGLAAAILVLISPVIQAAYTDVDILQFALNLEVRIRQWACTQLTKQVSEHSASVSAHPSPRTCRARSSLHLLQCLEAEFYSWVAFGVGLTADQAGTSRPPYLVLALWQRNLALYNFFVCQATEI